MVVCLRSFRDCGEEGERGVMVVCIFADAMCYCISVPVLCS